MVDAGDGIRTITTPIGTLGSSKSESSRPDPVLLVRAGDRSAWRRGRRAPSRPRAAGDRAERRLLARRGQSTSTTRAARPCRAAMVCTPRTNASASAASSGPTQATRAAYRPAPPRRARRRLRRAAPPASSRGRARRGSSGGGPSSSRRRARSARSDAAPRPLRPPRRRSSPPTTMTSGSPATLASVPPLLRSTLRARLHLERPDDADAQPGGRRRCGRPLRRRRRRRCGALPQPAAAPAQSRDSAMRAALIRIPPKTDGAGRDGPPRRASRPPIRLLDGGRDALEPCRPSAA